MGWSGVRRARTDKARRVITEINMFFWRHKKQRRDQIAGLVFRWRGARRHHAGKILALFFTTVFFAFSAYALRVEGLRAPLLTKRTGEVVLLSENNPHGERLMLQIEERSPFPLRWDPAFDKETMGRVAATASRLEGRVWNYSPALRPLPKSSQAVGLPSVSEGRAGFFVSEDRPWQDFSGSGDVSSTGFRGDLSVSALLVAHDGIKARLPSAELPLPGGVIADEWFGQSFRFLMNIDANGVVRGCLPLSGGSMEVAKPTEKQKLLVAWLHRTPFRPSVDGGDSVGVLELQIEAREQ